MSYIYVINKDELGNDITPYLYTISEKPMFSIPKIYKTKEDGTKEIIKCGFVYESKKSVGDLHKLYWKNKSIDFWSYDWSDPENPVLKTSEVNNKIQKLKSRHALKFAKDYLVDNFDPTNKIHRKIMLGLQDGITAQEANQLLTLFENNFTCTSSIEWWLETNPVFVKK